MPLHKLTIQNGINQQQTQTKNSTSWWACNLIRWRDGMVEKIGGWQKLFNFQLAGLARSLHAFEDLQNNLNLGIGTDNGLQIYQNGTLYNTNPVQQTIIAGYNELVGSGTTMVATSGSQVVTVTDASYNPVIGSSVIFPYTFYIGGIRVVGGTPFVVTGRPSGTTWTFNLGVNATANENGPVLPIFKTFGTTDVLVQYAGTAGAYLTAVPYYPSNWTPVVGQPFTVEAGVVALPVGNAKAVNLPAGTYLITNVYTFGGGHYANETYAFTINSGVVQNGSGAPFNGSDYSWGVMGGYSGAYAPNFPINYVSQSYPTGAQSYIDNQGQNMLFCFTGSPLYVWSPPISLPVTTSVVSTASGINAGMLVAMPQAQVVTWGSEPVIGVPVADPLLIRWSGAGSYTDWTATSSNQAGSYRLSSGSRIIGGIQIALTTLIWTDTDVWTMQYVGPPFVYSFTIVASGCGLLAPKGVTVLGSSAIWISQQQFYRYGTSGVQVVPCPIWDILFNNMDPDPAINKITAGTNSAFDEVIVSYASLTGDTDEIDSYVKFKPATGEWDYGSNNSSPGCSQYARTAWMDQSVFGSAMGGDLNKHIQQHEIGYDADGTAMAGVFAETGYADISDGDSIMTANEIIPDLKWFGNVPGAIMVTLKGVMYPQGPAYQKGPYGMDMQNRHIRPRIRARSIAARFDWVARLGYSARIGAVRVRAAMSGKRP